MPRLLTSHKADLMDGPLLSNLSLQCCFSHCLDVFWDYLHFIYPMFFCAPPQTQWWGFYWNARLRGSWQQDTLMLLRALESRFPWQSPCSALIFFDMCALSKLRMRCHQYIAFSLHYCFNQSSRYDSVCCVL